MDIAQARVIELTLLQTYAKRVEETIENLSSTDDMNYRQVLQQQLFRQISLFHKQLNNFQTMFPHDELLNSYGAIYLLFLAQQKAYSIGSWRVWSANTTSLVNNVLFGLVAKSQEKKALVESLELTEKSIALENTWHAQKHKVDCFLHLNRKQDAFEILSYMCQTFIDHPNYMFTREFKDSVELGFR
jgi:hypothetical protein